MRNSTAQKLKYTQIEHAEHTPTRAEIIDLAHARDVAKIAEAACHIPGNAEPCDYEEFMQKYGMKLSGDFE